MRTVKNGLTNQQQERLRERLTGERSRIQARLAERRAALGRSMSREPDEGEWAASSADQSLLARLTDRDSKLAQEIDRALAKLDAGRYGLCELTGEAIGFDRLWVRPWSRHAVASKDRVERQKVRGRPVDDERLGPDEGSPSDREEAA